MKASKSSSDSGPNPLSSTVLLLDGGSVGEKGFRRGTTETLEAVGSRLPGETQTAENNNRRIFGLRDADGRLNGLKHALLGASGEQKPERAAPKNKEVS